MAHLVSPRSWMMPKRTARASPALVMTISRSPQGVTRLVFNGDAKEAWQLLHAARTIVSRQMLGAGLEVLRRR